MCFFRFRLLSFRTNVRACSAGWRVALFSGAFAFTVAGCSRDPLASGTTTASPANRPQVLTFDLRGEIVGVRADQRRLLVHHEEIPNYMPAMTMEFVIGEADIGSFKEGQRIAAKMIDDQAAPDFRLESIRILDSTKESIIAAAARELQEDTFVRGQGAYREIGEVAPRFALYNQDGEVVRFEQLRGRRIVLNFIFTRCPVATMCPAATARMVALQKLAHARKIPDFQLLSISLDPAYDTPPILKAYATARGIDTADFSFLSGPEEAVRRLLTQFGVIAERGDNIWKHTLATLLIDRDGRIIHRVDGPTWEPEEFLKRL